MARLGQLGSTAATLAASAFFRFFALAATDEAVAPGITRYRPASPDFRDMVTLDVAVDHRRRLTHATLSVARAVLDDPRRAPFARDIVKSFVIAASDGRLGNLAEEIQFRDLAAPILARHPPTLPDVPSAAFRVAAGLDPHWTATSGNVALELANRAGVLAVAATAIPRRSWLARLLRR